MKKYLFLVVLAVLSACADDIVSDIPLADGKYTLTVNASKEPLSKALTLSGTTLNASWTKGDVVAVYKGANKVGELTAQGDGTSTTLKGSLDVAPSVDDVLTLKYLSPAYATQDGTLTGNATSLDKVCDYATATVTVKSISGGDVTIKEKTASFTNQQAIVKFTLLDNVDGTTPINATQLTVSDGTSTYTVTPASATNELYVAILGFSNRTVTLTATDGNYNYNYEKSGVTFTNGQYYAISVKTSALQGSGTEEKPYLISSEADWNYLAAKVNSGTEYANKFYRQTENIDVTTTMVGAGESKPFSGTYDGDGKTLNLSINASVRYASPFQSIKNATVKNVVTTGSVQSSDFHPSGLVGFTGGTCTIRNCRVSANVGGPQYLGGIVGHCYQANISIIGCVYTGTLNPASGQKTGGLLGWGGDGGGHTITISNCLFAGSLANTSTKFHPIGDLYDQNLYGANIKNLSNTYYTLTANIPDDDNNSFVQGLDYKGKFARSITAGSGVTISGLGASTGTYNVSGITAYAHGIKYNDVYYAGNGETVSLTLSHADAPSGYTFSQYTVTGGGTLANPSTNSPTLTMADANQTINVEWAFNTLTFNYTGAVQTFTALATGYYTLECYGAQGGAFTSNRGGYGGTSQLTYPLTQGDVLYIYVGGQGGSIAEYKGLPDGGNGGWNGGGKGGTGVKHHNVESETPWSGGGGGGGATHIATSAIGPITESTDFTSNHTNLLLIAGGGGGGCNKGIGGKGGGAEGEKGSHLEAYWNIAWNNGTCSRGKDGMLSSWEDHSCEGCGGGGGGYVGGNTWLVQYNEPHQCYSGAGGSSWGETTNGKGYSTTSGGATDGGNGKAVITWYGSSYPDN